MKLEEFKEKKRKKYHEDIDIDVIENEEGEAVGIEVWDPKEDPDKRLEEIFFEKKE